MRNRVAHDGVQLLRGLLARTAVLTILPATLLAAAATAAAANPQAGSEADAHISFGIAGPVGIAAVAVGLLGVIAGLVRRRRSHLDRARALTQAPAVTPDPVTPSRVA